MNNTPATRIVLVNFADDKEGTLAAQRCASVMRERFREAGHFVPEFDSACARVVMYTRKDDKVNECQQFAAGFWYAMNG